MFVNLFLMYIIKYLIFIIKTVCYAVILIH